MSTTMGSSTLECMTNVLDDNEWPAPAPTGRAANPAPWRLVRAREGWIGGVTGGLAEAAGIERGLVRVAFVFAAPSGLGFLAYLALWIFTPRAGDKNTPDPTLAPPSTASMIKTLLLVGAVVAAAGLFVFDPYPWNDAGGFFGIVLVGGGIAWLVHRRSAHDAGSGSPLPPPSSTVPPPPVPPVPPPVGPHGAVAHESEVITEAAGSADTPDSTLGMVPPAMTGRDEAGASESRSRAGELLLAVVMWLTVLGTIGVMLAVGAVVLFEAVDLPVAGLFFSLSTVVLGGMVVAAVGRRVRLFGASIAAMVVLVGVGAMVASFNGDVGRQTERVSSLDGLDSRYENAIGQLRIDLSALDFGGTTPTVVVEQGIGETDIVVPDAVAVELDYDVQMGELVMFGDSRDLFSDVGSTARPGEEGGGTVHIDAEVGAGSLRVCRASQADLVDARCR